MICGIPLTYLYLFQYLEFTNNIRILICQKIAGLNQMALQSISDIIWMTAPRNDTLQA